MWIHINEGGQGSGNKGHKGIFGHQGGSQPTGRQQYAGHETPDTIKTKDLPDEINLWEEGAPEMDAVFVVDANGNEYVGLTGGGENLHPKFAKKLGVKFGSLIARGNVYKMEDGQHILVYYEITNGFGGGHSSKDVFNKHYNGIMNALNGRGFKETSMPVYVSKDAGFSAKKDVPKVEESFKRRKRTSKFKIAKSNKGMSAEMKIDSFSLSNIINHLEK